MKTRIKTIEWEDSRHADDEATGYIDNAPVAEIQYGGQQEDDPNQITAWGLGPLEDAVEIEAPNREAAKAAFQAAFEKWWMERVEFFTDPVPYKAVMIVEGEQ